MMWFRASAFAEFKTNKSQLSLDKWKQFYGRGCRPIKWHSAYPAEINPSCKWKENLDPHPLKLLNRNRYFFLVYSVYFLMDIILLDEGSGVQNKAFQISVKSQNSSGKK